MSAGFGFFFAFVGLATGLFMWRKSRDVARADFIRLHPLPKGLYAKLVAKHPQLSPKDCHLVGQALRQYFLAHLKSGCSFVSMPSQVVDDLWHEFILHTKSYALFCDQAFGQFMHHTPAVVLGSHSQSNVGLRRCWWQACSEENINPRQAARLPLLFAIDAKLAIAGGFYYAADCQLLSRRDPNKQSGDGVAHCGGDFASPGIDGSTEGFGDAANTNANDGADGGAGCGGGGD